jgi:hypothetical protein
MKTSKIIFFSLLGTIAFLILAASIDVRLTGRKDTERIPMNVQNSELPPFSAVMIKNSEDVIITTGSSPEMSIEFLKKSQLPEINFFVKNDTLFISDYKQNKRVHEYRIMTLKSTGSLKSILAQNSSFEIMSPDLEDISLSLDSSRVIMRGVPAGKTGYRSLYFNAKNHSRISLMAFRTERIDISLENSTAGLTIKATNLKANLAKGSHLNTLQPDILKLESDQDSQFYIDHSAFIENDK